MTTREEKNKQIQDEIIEEELSKQRKRIVKRVLKITFTILFLFILFLLYTKYIATEGLIFKEERIVNSKIPNSFHGAKIIHFSDLDYGTTVYIEEVKSLVKKINLRNPDLILFSGDLIDTNYNLTTEESEQIIKELSKLKANIGKYATSGDEDQTSATTILTQAGFTTLNDEYELIYTKDNTPILLTGLSSSKTRDIPKAFNYFNIDTNNKNIYSILLMHEADDIDEIKSNYNIDLALAGGSMNGQIYIPGIGPLIKKEGFNKYYDEYYQLDNTKLYITSGIGTDGLQFRFLRRPSVNFLRLANH
ncbi:MAG: metallophosphoesterase [Bacilli bacterium]|nr:metallophosphoesterase [Bacilli bacterium]